jgi:adenine-specific DNA methylase
VAYLWARTVKCKSCRATIPLLKTRWLCKKDKKRVLLTMEPLVVGTSVPDSSDNDASTKVLTTNNQVSSRHFSA